MGSYQSAPEAKQGISRQPSDLAASSVIAEYQLEYLTHDTVRVALRTTRPGRTLFQKPWSQNGVGALHPARYDQALLKIIAGSSDPGELSDAERIKANTKLWLGERWWLPDYLVLKVCSMRHARCQPSDPGWCP